MFKYFVPKADITPRMYLGLTITSFMLLLAIWSALTYSGFVSNMFLPTPDQIVTSAIMLFTEFKLMDDVIASVLRVSAGFFLAALIGVPLGVLMGSLKVCEAFFEPILGFVRYMPASALFRCLFCGSVSVRVKKLPLFSSVHFFR